MSIRTLNPKSEIFRGATPRLASVVLRCLSAATVVWLVAGSVAPAAAMADESSAWLAGAVSVLAAAEQNAAVEQNVAEQDASTEPSVELEAAQRAQQDAERLAARDGAYRAGRRALDARRWKEAVEHFEAAASSSGTETDGAYYWLAYARHKHGDARAAMAALEDLERRYPESAWRDDARALMMEIRPGASVTNQDDDPDLELKILAMQSLMHSDSEQAIERLERFLDDEGPEELAAQAFFVLSQNPSPRAREILLATARGGRGKELQVQAVHYLGISGGGSSEVLEQLWSSAADRDLKEAIVGAMMAGEHLELARRITAEEQDPELRGVAIHALGMMGATDDLRRLYGELTEPESRVQVAHAFAMSGAVDDLIRIYRSESDVEVGREILHAIGLTESDAAKELLREVFRTTEDLETREAALWSLYRGEDADTLLEVARTAEDPEMRQMAFRLLGMTGDPRAAELALEILDQP